MVAEEWDPGARSFAYVTHPLSSKPPTSESNPCSPEELHSVGAMGRSPKLPPHNRNTEVERGKKETAKHTEKEERIRNKKIKERRITWQEKKVEILKEMFKKEQDVKIKKQLKQSVPKCLEASPELWQQDSTLTEPASGITSSPGPFYYSKYNSFETGRVESI